MSQQNEKSILEVQTAVYNYDNNLKNWAPKDAGASRVFIFHNTANNTYRIIGQSTHDKQYNINTPIKVDMVQKKLRDNFVQWRFRDTIYGLSFKTPEEADRFFGMVAKVVERLQGAQATLPAPITPTQSLSNVPSPTTTMRGEVSSNPTTPTANTPTLPRNEVSPTGSGIAVGGSVRLPAARKTMSSYGSPESAAPTQDPPTTPTLTQYASTNSLHHGTMPRRNAPPTGPTNCLYLKDAKDLSPRDLRAKEFYTSEESYMLGLDIIIDRYLEPGKERKVFTPEELKKIFANIIPIRRMSADLLSEMRRAMDDWSETTTIGDIFLRMLPFLKIYTEYCNGHKEANVLLDKLKAKRSVASFLKEAHTSSGSHLELNALLITPVQRIPRYQLLMKELLRQTDESHPDHAQLTQALEKIKFITDSINESVLCSDSTKEIEQLKKIIPDLSNLLTIKNLMKTRQLVKHGKVSVTTSKTAVKYTYLLLFSDIVAFASPLNQKSAKKLKIEERIRLHQMWVDSYADDPVGRMWQITTPDATYLIEAINKDDKTLWVDKVQQRIQSTSEKKGVLPDISNVQLRNFRFKFSDTAQYKGDWVNAKMEGTGTYNFATGNVYEGSWEAGKFNGHGVMTYITGEVYDGDWVRDRPHGQGTLKSAVAVFVGGWEQGVKHGHGKITYTHGDCFEGEFVKGLREGHGTLKCADGSSYEGAWKADLEEGQGTRVNCYGTYVGDWTAGMKDGQGTMTYTNGDVYTGQWSKDKKSGQGTLTFIDGVKYEGNWAQDLYDGTGVLTKPGYLYEGEFKQGRLAGPGKETTAEGVYEGAWSDDRREGKGSWKATSGLIYEGEWHGGEQSGKGMLIDVDKSRYDGKFVRNCKEGTGVLTYPSGAKYAGSWQHNKRHGKGIFDGAPIEGHAAVKYMGDWVDDVREGQGALTDATGTYDGDWKQDMRNGSGKFTYPNGNVFVGSWKDDKRHGKGTLTLSKAETPTVISLEYENGDLKEPSFAFAPPDIPLPRVLTQK